MPREQLSVLAMGVVLGLSQLLAILVSGTFRDSGLQAFPQPENPTNALVYIVMILVFTAVILALVRYRRRDLVKYVILGSIFLTLVFVLLLPLLYGLYFLSPGLFDTDLGGNLATVLAFGVAGLLVVGLVKYPEWYVVDAVGLAVAVGVTAIMGISFGVLPAILLLTGLAVYDAWAVYRTKHMVALADELTTQRLPVLLVIPKRANYSFRAQKGLKEQLESGEDREAMFIGLGDLIIPGVMSVSAFNFLSPSVTFLGVPGHVAVALMTVVGSLVGFAVLMRFVVRGNPQAGLPLLNGGAIAGFLVGSVSVYGSLTAGIL
ncbi:MAG TPA: presenilin family intramembrane aspartyl protease PSH [Thermoplasmata archaeon]|nr:presenilin family intramembrane aspartyl protease PSH [Thermoplasmata archaeon]